jgi:hypothetical protein
MPVPPKSDDPAELEVTEDQIALQAIAEVNQALDQARIDEAKKKEAYTKAKARTKEAAADREQVLHDFTTALPLFDRPRPAARTPHPETVEAPAPAEAVADSPADPEAAASAGPEPGDESWRSLSLAEFRMPAKQLDLLNAADLWTVGQYSEWCRTPGNHLDAIKGLGPASLVKIADAETDFWYRWRAGEYLPPAPASEAVDEPPPVAEDATADEPAPGDEPEGIDEEAEEQEADDDEEIEAEDEGGD